MPGVSSVNSEEIRSMCPLWLSTFLSHVWPELIKATPLDVPVPDINFRTGNILIISLNYVGSWLSG